MTYRQDFTVPAEIMEQVQEQGLDILPELIRIVVNAASTCKQDLTNIPKSVEATPTGINRRRCERGSETSPLQYRKCEKAGSIPRRWRKGCGANELSRWPWQRCMFKACRPARSRLSPSSYAG